MEKLSDSFSRKYMKKAVRASTIHVSSPNYSIVLNLSPAQKQAR